jgi:predicted kinase
VNQDELGSRKLVEMEMEKAIREGFDVIVDRCNFDYWQRNIWIKLCSYYNITQIWCLFFDIPVQICKKRVSVRTNHPSIPSGDYGTPILDIYTLNTHTHNPSILSVL